jgi:hypothetical protein
MVDPAFLIIMGTLYELILNPQKLDMKGTFFFQLSLSTHMVFNYIFLIQNKKNILFYMYFRKLSPDTGHSLPMHRSAPIKSYSHYQKN